MLFTYSYIPHQMEKMQTFIDFIFNEVWCKAPESGPFGLNLFDANAELREVMEAFYYSDAHDAELFYRNVEGIYGLFSALAAVHIDQFQQWYRGNNCLEKVCANDPNAQLARYSDIAVNHKDLAERLGTFFKGLYSQSLLDLVALRDKIGDIDDHYRSFVQTNRAGKCPFCGVADIKGPHHSKREAYDHYLPKALYPFNSINFRNLAPTCHECNSTYKLSKDPAHNAAGRRKAFNPYAEEIHTITITVTLHSVDVDNLRPADVSLQFGPDSLVEELETWKDLYGIEERYKAKFCAEYDGKAWLTQVLDEWMEQERTPEEYLQALASSVQKRPFADCNFLKKPFLDACEEKGILKRVTKARAT